MTTKQSVSLGTVYDLFTVLPEGNEYVYQRVSKMSQSV